MTWGGTIQKVSLLLEAWETYEPPADDVRRVPPALNHFLEQFNFITVRHFRDTFRKRPSWMNDNDVRPVDGVLRLPVITTQQQLMIPVARPALQTVQGTLWVTLRVGIFTDALDPTVGWRFEAPDPPDREGPRSHQYAHAQFAAGWHPRCPGFGPQALFAPPAEAAPIVNESRPAFSLRCSTPAELIVAAITALHGTKVAEDMLTAANGHGVTITDFTRAM